MAVLSDNDRAEAWAELMRLGGSFGASGSLTKADLRAAINGIDQYISDNAAAINSAIPQPARGVLNAAQKNYLVELVARKRRERGT